MAVRTTVSNQKKSSRLKPYDKKMNLNQNEHNKFLDSDSHLVYIQQPKACSDEQNTLSDKCEQTSKSVVCSDEEIQSEGSDELNQPSSYVDTCEVTKQTVVCSDDLTQPLGYADTTEVVKQTVVCSDEQFQPESSDEHNQPLGCTDTCEATRQTKACSDEQIQPHSETTQDYPCVSARQPYAGLILNGLKTIETRWTSVFKDLENQTVAIHIAQRTWEGKEWREALHLRGISNVQIDCMVSEAEKYGRGVIAGLVDVGETWQCIPNIKRERENITEWESAALLKPLDEKYLTRLSNPRWLTQPIRTRGQKGIWTVHIPEENV